MQCAASTRGLICISSMYLFGFRLQGDALSQHILHRLALHIVTLLEHCMLLADHVGWRLGANLHTCRYTIQHPHADLHSFALTSTSAHSHVQHAQPHGPFCQVLRHLAACCIHTIAAVAIHIQQYQYHDHGSHCRLHGAASISV